MMKLRYDLSRKGTFLYHTGLYTEAASSLISSIKTLCQVGLEMCCQATKAPYNSYVLGDFTEIITDDDGEVLINGIDSEFFYGHHKTFKPINEASLLSLTKRLIELELPAEKPSAPDFSQESFKVSLIPNATSVSEISIKKKDLFILRDHLSGSPKETLYKKYSKNDVDAFIGKPDNEFVIALKKELKEKTDKLKDFYQKQRDDFTLEINEKRKALTSQLVEFLDASKSEELNKIDELKAEMAKLISANQ